MTKRQRRSYRTSRPVAFAMHDRDRGIRATQPYWPIIDIISGKTSNMWHFKHIGMPYTSLSGSNEYAFTVSMISDYDASLSNNGRARMHVNRRAVRRHSVAIQMIEYALHGCSSCNNHRRSFAGCHTLTDDNMRAPFGLSQYVLVNVTRTLCTNVSPLDNNSFRPFLRSPDNSFFRAILYNINNIRSYNIQKVKCNPSRLVLVHSSSISFKIIHIYLV